ncbi:MAG: OsmC family peroxiredoxin [Gammaproteobacteria bacterium]|nr:OsmC family peroxiredoxin [Gammaproteobacteria bacterium]
MQSFPHHYRVLAEADATGDVCLFGEGLDAIPSAPPPEFGGPGDEWSPETLLTASVAGCFILTFRAIARAARFEWMSLDCEVEGTLDHTDGPTRFTGFVVHATLSVPDGADHAKALHLLEKAEEGCLITNSLCGPTRLEAEVVDS